MFETAELGQTVSKKEYREREPILREQLLEAQGELRRASFPVIVLFAGVDGAGKGETANLLSEWMDPRGMVTRAFDAPSQEEAERPEFWRYWRDLPPRGRIGMFLSAWYHDPLLRKVYRKIDDERYDDRLDEIVSFERTLADDGALILKFWMHLGRQAQRKRLKALEKDPLQHWRVSLEVGTILLEGIRRRLADEATLSAVRTSKESRSSSPEPAASVHPTTILSRLDMHKRLAKRTYQAKLHELQGRLNLLHHDAREKKLSTILVFEGWDAAGKGGAIRRITAALDARAFQVISIAAPTDEERDHHYLWRFWRHLPRAGRVTIFDRSWYGRVLVERVEGFATEKEWRRAYAEINDFEQQLIDHGVVLVKFWIHITKEEQEARFKAREETPYKRWKMSDEDWRNREKWDAYDVAVNSMIERTSTRIAPWNLVQGNDKRYARIKVLDVVCDNLERSLGKNLANLEKKTQRRSQVR
jgi:polyphosphate kinase 2 (PPK2 family)